MKHIDYQPAFLLVMQTVHFIRHGEGFHNIGFDGNLDAHLTPFGWSQAHALNSHIQSLQLPLNIQVSFRHMKIKQLHTYVGSGLAASSLLAISTCDCVLAFFS